jgi:hypothetical protein
MRTDDTVWRNLRDEFERLPLGEFHLSWDEVPGGVEWAWFGYPNETLRTRICAIARRAAGCLGLHSEWDWFDRVRRADFVDDGITGWSKSKRADETYAEGPSGVIEDVVKHSITLCHLLEAEAESAVKSDPTAPRGHSPLRKRATRGKAEKQGRPVVLVDGAKIKELRGERTQPVFARACRISVDALQLAEVHGRSSDKTINKLAKKLHRENPRISLKNLLKNAPQ